MSALGPKQTCLAQDGMSASPLKADIATTTWHVGYGQETEITIQSPDRRAAALMPATPDQGYTSFHTAMRRLYGFGRVPNIEKEEGSMS
jgi:hypothetical protein